MEREVEIARLGAQGDGVAEGAGGPIYVSFALPGELVRITVEPGHDRAELLAPGPRLSPGRRGWRHFGASRLSSFRRKPESRGQAQCLWLWIPACAGMTEKRLSRG